MFLENGRGILKLLRKYDFLLFRNPILVIELAPLNKKFHGKKYAKFVIAWVFFIRLTSNFYHKIALIFKLSILHTISYDNYFGIVQH